LLLTRAKHLCVLVGSRKALSMAEKPLISNAGQFRAQIHDFHITDIAKNPVSFLCRMFPNNAQDGQAFRIFQ